MKRSILNPSIALILGVGLVAILLWALNGATAPVAAAPASSTPCAAVAGRAPSV